MWARHREDLATSAIAAPGSLRVRLSRDTYGYTGEVSVELLDQPVVPRRVQGEQCKDVVDALALAGALLLPAVTAPHSSVAAQAPSAGDAPQATAPSLASVTVALQPAQPSARADVVPQGRSRAAWGLGGGVGIDLLLALAPSPIASPQLALQLDGRRGIRPWLRLTAVGGASARTSGSRADVRFAVAIARLEAAPGRLQLGPRLDVSASLGIESGMVRAEGVGGDLAHTYRTQAPWLATVQGVRLRIGLSPHFSLELAGGLVEPLLRATYTIESPHVVIYRTPRITGYTGLAFLFRVGEKTTTSSALGDQIAASRPISM